MNIVNSALRLVKTKFCVPNEALNRQPENVVNFHTTPAKEYQNAQKRWILTSITIKIIPYKNTGRLNAFRYFQSVKKAADRQNTNLSINSQCKKECHCEVPQGLWQSVLLIAKTLATQGVLTYCTNRTLPYLCTPTGSICLSRRLLCPLAVCQK